MLKKILIIGGGGYVGSVLVPFLLKHNYEIIVYDIFLYGNILKKNKNLSIIKGDIRDYKLLKEIITKVDAIIHLACISNDPSFELNPKLGKSINFDSFLPLIEICNKEKIKNFIYASSSSVYGVKEEAIVNEDVELNPLTDYSFYKAECEKILLKSDSNNFITTILRPATVCGYGPRQRLDVVVNILTNFAYHKRKMTVFGGDQKRPNIHINDMARAYYHILKSPNELINNQIFNVGIDNKTVIEIANLVKNIVGNDVNITKETTNDNRSYHIDSSKIKRVLNFEFNYSISDAINDLVFAFENKLLINTFKNEDYFNIKKMQSTNIK